MANNEEGNDSCMYNANLFSVPIIIVDGALAQPKSSITSIWMEIMKNEWNKRLHTPSLYLCTTVTGQ